MAVPALPIKNGRARLAAGGAGDALTKAAWTGFSLLGVLLLVDLGAMIFRRSWTFSPLVDGWLIIGFQLAACALCLASALGRHRHRRVALAMGVACLSWTVGDVLFTLESLHGATPSTPSAADGFFLLFFPVALTAVVLFVRAEITRRDAVNWLDGGIAALGMAAVCSLFAFRGSRHLTFSLAFATHISYPVADLLLLGIVAGSTVFVSSARRAALVMIAIGIAVNAAGDTIFFVQPASGASQFSAVLNAVAWPFDSDVRDVDVGRRARFKPARTPPPLGLHAARADRRLKPRPPARGQLVPRRIAGRRAAGRHRRKDGTIIDVEVTSDNVDSTGANAGSRFTST
jgi:hypothetical protein